jgi:GT2 family glycosyltransferase
MTPLIVMTTFNRMLYTRQTLESLAATPSDFVCVIVDNGSRPDSAQFLKDWVDRDVTNRFIVKFLDKNYGVGKAVNYGARLRKPGQHLMKLDNDVVLPTVANSINAGELNPTWLMQTLDLLENNRESLSHVGFSSYPDIYLKTHSHEFVWEALETTTGNKHEIMFYRGKTVLGAAVMYHGDVVDELGNFSEETVYGWEDNKYSKQAHRYGRGVYLLSVKAEHIGAVEYAGDGDELRKIKDESLAHRLKATPEQVKEKPPLK